MMEPWRSINRSMAIAVQVHPGLSCGENEIKVSTLISWRADDKLDAIVDPPVQGGEEDRDL
eukprot:753328-Hanusia_phi.AAC.2